MAKKQKPLRSRNASIKKIPVKDLLPDPLNWHTHGAEQRTALKGVFEEVGFVGFILVRKAPGRGKYFIIDGHERVETIRETYGEDQEVDCSVLNLSEAEARKILISHDAIGSMGGVDFSILDELASLTEFDDDVLSGIIQDALRGTDEVEAGRADSEMTGDSKGGTPDESSSKEIDPERFELECTCPKCGFEFNPKA